MSQEDFSRAALVLLGHGTTLNAESAAPVLQHAAELRRRKLFAEVREAFWKQEPRVQNVLGSLTNSCVFIVPLFVSEGYFSEQVIPRELGFCQEGRGHFLCVRRRGAQTLFYCRPVGTHDRMTDVLVARARETIERYPFPRAPRLADTTLFLAGHGTGQNENSRKTIERQVGLIRALKLFGAVEAVFLEEEPRVADCYRLAQTKNVVVVPFFISDGLHAAEDIPVLLGESERVVRQRLEQRQAPWRNPTERHGKLVWYTPSVGTDPLIADVILAQVRDAAVNPVKAVR